MQHVCVFCRCIDSSNVCLMVCRMAGRDDCAIVYALDSVAQALHKHQNQAGDEFCGLGNFQRNNLPTFTG